MRRLRWAPFIILSVVAIWYAAQAPDGRKPFEMNFDVAPATLAHVAIKPVHFRAFGILCWLAIVAVGAPRMPLAIALTLLVGLAVEIVQGTVAGHNARLADMLPNVIAACSAAVIYRLGAAFVRRSHAEARHPSATERPASGIRTGPT
jgi:VanZ family protein